MLAIIEKIKDWLSPSSSLKTVSIPQQLSTTLPSSISLSPNKVDNDTDPKRTSKLIMVTADNNNKFYEMTENGDGNFTASYGRVGSKKVDVIYPMHEWETKYREKIRKGYTDQTHLFATKSSETDTNTIDNLSVRTLIETFMRFANQSILLNYVVLASQVTKKQVEEAQILVDKLIGTITKGMDEQLFNQNLLALFKVIPRKMANVKENLLTNSPQTDDDLKKIQDQLVNEQATLDVMRSQVEINEQQSENEESDQNLTLLQLLGLQIELVEDPRIIKLVKLMMGSSSNKFQEVYQVTHFRTQKIFDKWIEKIDNKKTQLLWHGSRNENWMSILKTGLVLRPASAIITGKMFGYGIYFANEFSKSLNYSSVQGAYWTAGKNSEGYLAIFEVHTGNQWTISQHDSSHVHLNEIKLKKENKNYDSVYAKRGISLSNNEFIVYNEAQCTIKYIVKIK